jgi:hypothetical protein
MASGSPDDIYIKSSKLQYLILFGLSCKNIVRLIKS